MKKDTRKYAKIKMKLIQEMRKAPPHLIIRSVLIGMAIGINLISNILIIEHFSK